MKIKNNQQKIDTLIEELKTLRRKKAARANVYLKAQTKYSESNQEKDRLKTLEEYNKYLEINLKIKEIKDTIDKLAYIEWEKGLKNIKKLLSN